ncbi:sodium Bile acid symporter family protein [Leptospira broomii serovar Hurstbridge str. 5399]|uniref:Sodium Bile acid symporter family protein n=1 Tax=Leptospira broomii serovar Hurstbridge str. 5399 TaxID=1049789 RepID=T0FFS8_9LEPT|nr:bile acid:sodium symporter [Leptospira broomii]EQA46761.1 sodium Bile acid symporter family protein [Leptospira broomii serovar Hurstbridge str. 5399]
MNQGFRNRISESIESFFQFIHKYFFYCIIFSYLVGGAFPQLGLLIRDTDFGQFHLFGGGNIKVSLSLVLLSLLLFNAGLGIHRSELMNLFKKPTLLIVGLFSNLSIPIAFTYFVSLLMIFWHNPDEVQNILVGLALIASMPIAASSTAWSQKSNGNLALSLGLVVFSTILSPVTTPIGLHSIGFITTGDYSDDLHEIADDGIGAFLFLSVLVPTVAGIGLHFLLPKTSIEAAKKPIKDVNLLNLLILNYSNASVVLPGVFREPDWDFLFIIVLITGGLCAFAFFTGFVLSRIFKSSDSERSSLVFGLGMNNNGTGLVLASLSLVDHPSVMLPIIFYNLIQHIVAGYVDKKLTNP